MNRNWTWPATPLLVTVFVSACGQVPGAGLGPTPTREPFPTQILQELAAPTAIDAEVTAAPGEGSAGPPGSGTAIPPALPAEGVSLIAFASDFNGADFEIFVVEPNGQNLVQLTDNDAQDFAPSWSPDGTRIAFHSDAGGDDDIYVMGADGSQPTALTTDGVADTFPAWSPDGTRLAFISTWDGDADLWSVELETGVLTQLSNDPEDPSNPDWSPDGTRIAFTSSRQGEGRVRIMLADEASAVGDAAQNAFYPDWSPVSEQIAYAAQEDSLNIYTVRADGADPVRLTDAPLPQHSPSFSPDGQQIVFVQQDGDISDLWVMNADGSDATQITNGLNPLMPRWSP